MYPLSLTTVLTGLATNRIRAGLDHLAMKEGRGELCHPPNQIWSPMGYTAAALPTTCAWTPCRARPSHRDGREREGGREISCHPPNQIRPSKGHRVAITTLPVTHTPCQARPPCRKGRERAPPPPSLVAARVASATVRQGGCGAVAARVSRVS
jgi:hypothetical protein